MTKLSQKSNSKKRQTINMPDPPAGERFVIRTTVACAL